MVEEPEVLQEIANSIDGYALFIKNVKKIYVFTPS